MTDASAILSPLSLVLLQSTRRPSMVDALLPPSSPLSFLTLSHPQYLKDGTQFFSRASPNLPDVIPAMDKIDTFFTENLRDLTLNPAIRAAIIQAKNTLNKYYELTDHAEVYRIAMGPI